VNGVVVPTLSIALGTLLATTINVLRSRQVTMRESLNREAGDIRFLRQAINGMYGTAQHTSRRARALGSLRDYSSSVLHENQASASEFLEAKATSRGISSSSLDELASMLHGVDGASVSREFSTKTAAELLVFLNAHRSARLAAFRSDFPRSHYNVILLLASSICLVFLVESNQEVLQYLNVLQLRGLFSILVAVCSSTAALLFDLADPFQGSFCIEAEVADMAAVHAMLQQDVDALSTTQVSKPSDGEWGAKDTLFFHLLTGRLADQVRAIREVVAFRKPPATRRPPGRLSGWWRRRRSAASAAQLVERQGIVGHEVEQVTEAQGTDNRGSGRD